MLIDKSNHTHRSISRKNIEGFEIDSLQAFSMLYRDKKEKVESDLINGRDIILNKNCFVIDIRTKAEFDHFHLPGALQIDFQKLMTSPAEIFDYFKNKKILFVCNLGLKSNAIVNQFRKSSIEAYSLKGGMSEWSNLNFPRWRPETCLKK